MRSRARFTPARAADGSPRFGAYAGRIAWRIPGAPPAPAVAFAPEHAAQARADLASLFSDEDYPAAALAARQSGRVEFTLGVGASGRVEACTITRSSGSGALDSATCRLLRSRARFTPARDAAGNPVASETRSYIVWRLPATSAPKV